MYFFRFFCSIVSLSLYCSINYCWDHDSVGSPVIDEVLSSQFSKDWLVGGDLMLQFRSDSHFAYNQYDNVQLSAHLPGFSPNGDAANCKHAVQIQHIQSESHVQLTQRESSVEIHAPWCQKFPADFIHFLYGVARLAWLQNKKFPVHGACIGNDDDGYILLVGAPGSGKTSLALYNALYGDYKIFSGDKTLLTFTDTGRLEAIAGTRTITIRLEDIPRWSTIPKVNEHVFGDRLAFQLPSNYYATNKSVAIKQICFVDLNDGILTTTKLSPLSALHSLYPFFLDKQREDILIGADQALLEGSIAQEIKKELVKNLYRALQNIPVYKISASLQEVTQFIQSTCAKLQQENNQATYPDLSKNVGGPKKILFGICGIGNGHYNRQLPILCHLLQKGHRIMVFTYGEGLIFFNERFPQHMNLTVIPVANPYYVGTPEGLDFEKTALSEKNTIDFCSINSFAMHRATKEFGCPDLVISDYEMVSAQYAYTKGASLVTLDQQSKYLVGDFPRMLHGTSYIDEVERLLLFFPKTIQRIAVSFFKVPFSHLSKDRNVEIFSPMIRPEIIAAKGREKSKQPSILVYVTAQQLGNQPINEWINTIRTVLPQNFEAHIFLPKRLNLPATESRLYFYHHGNPRFDPLLIDAHGIVTTAGHTLLSEAMYLEKPVYALPLPLYEQQLNAHTIAQGGFGIREDNLTAQGLRTFVENLEIYANNIRNDTVFLLKEPGNTLILQRIDQLLQDKR